MARRRTALNLPLMTAHLMEYSVPNREILTTFHT